MKRKLPFVPYIISGVSKRIIVVGKNLSGSARLAKSFIQKITRLLSIGMSLGYTTGPFH